MNFTDNCHLVHWSHAQEAGVKILYATKAYNSSLLVVFCAVNIMAAILSVSGNVIVFLTVVSFSRLHITSNFGLASLAAANAFEGLSTHGFSAIASVITLQGGSPSRVIRVFTIFLANVCVNSSLLNLSLVTVERYIGVIHSLRYHHILHERRFAKVIAAVWIFSLLLSISNLVDNAVDISRTLTTVIFSLTVIVTMYCNLRIYCHSRRQRRQIVAEAAMLYQIANANQQRFRGATTMFATFVTLVVCFIPALVIRLLLVASSGAENRTSLSLIRPWAAVFFGLHSFVNPFIYFFRSPELRRYSKKLLCGHLLVS